MNYLRTVILLGRNFTLRSWRNLPVTSLFLALPIILLVIFGSIGRVTNSSADFNGLFAIFSGLSLMMLGVVGLATMLPMDKKLGVLRRLQATPFKASQLMLGCMISSLVLGFIAIALMTIIAVIFFNFTMQGSYFDFAIFMIISLAMTVGIGLAIGGWARNDTSAGFVSQLFFLGSLALGGVWFPREVLPDWLQAISNFMPMTPIIQGVEAIATNGHTLLDLGPQLGVIALWILVAYILGAKLFRWEADSV